MIWLECLITGSSHVESALLPEGPLRVDSSPWSPHQPGEAECPHVLQMPATPIGGVGINRSQVCLNCLLRGPKCRAWDVGLPIVPVCGAALERIAPIIPKPFCPPSLLKIHLLRDRYDNADSILDHIPRWWCFLSCLPRYKTHNLDSRSSGRVGTRAVIRGRILFPVMDSLRRRRCGIECEAHTSPACQQSPVSLVPLCIAADVRDRTGSH